MTEGEPDNGWQRAEEREEIYVVWYETEQSEGNEEMKTEKSPVWISEKLLVLGDLLDRRANLLNEAPSSPKEEKSGPT